MLTRSLCPKPTCPKGDNVLMKIPVIGTLLGAPLSAPFWPSSPSPSSKRRRLRDKKSPRRPSSEGKLSINRSAALPRRQRARRRQRRPPLRLFPRDLSLASFKCRCTPSGALPTDQNLLRTLTQGMPGTPMTNPAGCPMDSGGQAGGRSRHQGFFQEVRSPTRLSLHRDPAPSRRRGKRGQRGQTDLSHHEVPAWPWVPAEATDPRQPS